MDAPTCARLIDQVLAEAWPAPCIENTITGRRPRVAAGLGVRGARTTLP
jgi:hypothetical protein